jgi:hypothetical protein
MCIKLESKFGNQNCICHFLTHYNKIAQAIAAGPQIGDNSLDKSQIDPVVAPVTPTATPTSSVVSADATFSGSYIPV